MSSSPSMNSMIPTSRNNNNNRSVHTSHHHHHSHQHHTTSMIPSNSRRPNTTCDNSTVMTTASVKSRAASHQKPVSTLLCNLCSKPLVTTCFLCACDCIFCEECTYSHFEHNSKCPTCFRTLSESDFTELVVTEREKTSSPSSENEISKTTLQALFSKQSSVSSVGLPLSDLCFSLVRQIDIMKKSTKFLLKQLLMDSNLANRRNFHLGKTLQSQKQELTQLRQSHNSQKIQYESLLREMNTKLKAREDSNMGLTKKLKEQDRIIEQFRNLQGGLTVNGNSESVRNGNPISNHPTHVSTNQIQQIQQPPQDVPPLKGIMMQREAQQVAQQQVLSNLHHRRRPMASSSSGNRRPITGPPGPLGYSPHLTQQQRPFSSNSSIGNTSVISSNTPRIRELSSNSSYTGYSSQQNLNKRRRVPSTSHSTSRGMSPNTAFTLNQGPHTVNRNGMVMSSVSGVGFPYNRQQQHQNVVSSSSRYNGHHGGRSR